MCVVKDRVALQDINLTIASQPESASPDLGEKLQNVVWLI